VAASTSREAADFAPLDQRESQTGLRADGHNPLNEADVTGRDQERTITGIGGCAFPKRVRSQCRADQIRNSAR